MKKLFFIILSLFIINIQAQKKVDLDSLFNVLKTNISEKQKVDTYIQIVRQVRKTDSLQAITNINKALNIAKKINYKEGIIEAKFEEAFFTNLYGNPELALNLYKELIKNATKIGHKKIIGKSYFQIGLIYKTKSDYSNSIKNNIKSAEAFEEIKDTASFIVVYSYIAGLSLYQDNYAFALKYYLKLLDISKKKNDLEGIALCYNNIGIIHKQNNEFDDAINNYKKSLIIYEKLNDSARISDCLNNIGSINEVKGNYSEAMINLKKSLGIRIKLKDTFSIAESYNSIGKVEFGLGNFTKSLENYFQSIQINKSFESKLNKTNSLIGIGKNYYKQNKFNNAKQYLEEGIFLAKEIPSPDLIGEGTKYLSKVENELGNYKNAYNNHLIFSKIEDSLRNKEMLKKLTIMQANFAFEQRLDSINFQNEKNQQIISQRLEDEQKIGFFTLFVLIIVIIFSFILFHKNKRIKQTNHQLSKANIELQKQRNELDSMNKTKTRFFSIIAHDIRGPIGNFIGFFDLLRDHIKENYSEKHNEDKFLDNTLNLLNKSKDQLLNLLDGLLNWALKEENVIPHKPENLNLKNYIDKNIEIYLQQAKAKNIQLLAEIDENIYVWADKNCVMTILRNLTSNALKFSTENSSIYFKASTNNNFTEIQVIDQGVGISAEKLKNIFDIDENKTTIGTKGEKGTGLGLNIVHDFVKLNNGQITVTSELNVGTTFNILLPKNKVI
ncbi:hypothetical protein EC396_16605 [Lutibacter sp. HS1-25]|uniref:tetratricopeptide repeat-containing sensor histidine kinase n=1 Tax=Lutibacter sp. HS1-25 TaxID=2485000 RepID=UPI0010102D48|nr:tetratricopeptide repeat protein [Lutibacter sp. HS1-25]RXP44782.1 hypothetical protein EC396_16605 [Lutibacter sp. HS1-25]